MDWHKGPFKYGVRIDHILHSEAIRVKRYHIDYEERENAKGASDHLPVSVLLDKRKK